MPEQGRTWMCNGCGNENPCIVVVVGVLMFNKNCLSEMQDAGEVDWRELKC